MDRQDELTWRMRGILIDWLVEVHIKFRLLPETIFLATHIVDRFPLFTCRIPGQISIGRSYRPLSRR